MKREFVKHLVPVAIVVALMASCSSSRVVLSNSANIYKYRYVVFGNESLGDRELDDIVLEVRNMIAETDLQVLSSSSDVSKILECSDSILSPYIQVTTEKWEGGHTFITVTFHDYTNNERIAVVKSSGIGMSIKRDQQIALGAIRRKLNQLFKKH